MAEMLRRRFLWACASLTALSFFTRRQKPKAATYVWATGGLVQQPGLPRAGRMFKHGCAFDLVLLRKYVLPGEFTANQGFVDFQLTRAEVQLTLLPEYPLLGQDLIDHIERLIEQGKLRHNRYPKASTREIKDCDEAWERFLSAPPLDWIEDAKKWY